MASLNEADVSLLTTMISTAASIWAIGFAVYAFIFNYLERWVIRKQETSPEWLPDREERRRLRSNVVVFLGFLLDGLFAFGTILAAALTIAFDNPAGIGVAGVFYSLTLGGFVFLFVNELRTSIGSVVKLLRRA